MDHHREGAGGGTVDVDRPLGLSHDSDLRVK
jgi:hypothetical protein